MPFFPALGASHVREAGMLIRKLKVNPWRKLIWAWLTPAEKKRAETSLRFEKRKQVCVHRWRLGVCSFGMIWIWNSDPRSLGSWCIKSIDESTLDKYPSVLLMHHHPSDLGSLIQIRIIPKEHTLVSKGSRVSRKSRRASKQHPIES